MYINCIIKLKYYIKRDGKETNKKGIYCGLSCLINTYIKQNRIWIAFLVKLVRI